MGKIKILNQKYANQIRNMENEMKKCKIELESKLYLKDL
jgi:hypothetical protein